MAKMLKAIINYKNDIEKSTIDVETFNQEKKLAYNK